MIYPSYNVHKIHDSSSAGVKSRIQMMRNTRVTYQDLKFGFIAEKTKHKPVLINVIRYCCNSKLSASLLTCTNSTRFWPIWYPNVSLVFADYIHTWKNLNSVINAGSLDSAKEDSKTYFASKRVQPCCFRDLRTAVFPASFESSRSSSRHFYASVGLWELFLH